MTEPPPDDRTPPQDLNAERCVLGGMLLSKDAIADVVEVLRPVDFYRPAHQTLYEAILDLYARGEPADPVSLSARLTAQGLITKLGGGQYLHTLIAAVPTAANAGYYAVIVRDLAVRRRLIQAGTKVVQVAYTTPDVGDAVDSAQAAVYDVVERRNSEDVAPLGDTLIVTMDEIESIASRGGELFGIPTGFADLDALTNGLHGGQLIVIGGRPGTGKSTLATDWLRSATIRYGQPAAIFSLEMSRTEITMRVLSAESRVPLQAIRTGTMNDQHWDRLARRMGEIAKAPMYLDDSPNMTLMEIRAKARRLKQRQGLSLMVIDYLQLMTSPKRVENRQQEVAEFSRSLKLLAKELDIPVVAVSQLNRGSEQRADKKPQLADLRESGAVEQDADLVILMHREDLYDHESRPGEADLIVAKHRNGPTSTVVVSAQLHYARFASMAPA